MAVPVVAALVLALSPASASGQTSETGTINIVSAELTFDSLGVQELNVDGTATCARGGVISIVVDVLDTETGAETGGVTQTTCPSPPGNSFRWLVTLHGAGFRGGDRVIIDVAATGIADPGGPVGPINDTDHKETILHWQT